MAKKVRNLSGQVAAVTGGARGIGRATSEALLRRGATVAIGDVDADAAQATASELGRGAIALPLDVSDRSSFEAFLDQTEEQLGPLDVLINNAGIMPVGRFIDEDERVTTRQLDINLHGVILGMRLALARMLPRDHGHIVNISSQAGRFPTPGGATYSATKHAVIGLTEAVRGELRLMGASIDLSYVMPFVVNTELGTGLGSVRGMRPLEPSEVATAIMRALERREVEVWVPRSARRTHWLSAVVPRALAERTARAIGADRVLAGADSAARRQYELRAASPRPQLQPPPPGVIPFGRRTPAATGSSAGPAGAASSPAGGPAPAGGPSPGSDPSSARGPSTGWPPPHGGSEGRSPWERDRPPEEGGSEEDGPDNEGPSDGAAA